MRDLRALELIHLVEERLRGGSYSDEVFSIRRLNAWDNGGGEHPHEKLKAVR